MKKLLSIAILLAGTLVMVSCGDDEDPVATFDQPSVSAGSAGDLANGASGTVDFTVTLDSDLTAAATWSLSSSGVSSASIGGATSGTINASGTVTVDVDGGTTAGAAQITLTVTNPSEDPQGGSGNATAVFSILPVGDNPIAISMIPATASIDFGSDLTAPYQVDAADGIASVTVSVNGGTAVAAFTDDLSANPTSISGDFTYAWQTLLDLGGAVGNNAVVFTATDVDGDVDEFTHTLTVGEAPVTPVVLVRGDIEGTVDWTADNIYQLDTRVTVLDGATLNIAPGTVIKGNEGQGAAATALLVAKGGTLNASGSAALPIIFTSVLDPIDPADVAAGNYASTTSPSQAGLWGGVIILGEASITAKIEDEDGNLVADNLTEIQIEGIPSSDENGLYGGSNDADNSGTITYISIRHGGTNIGAGNEINGLTLGGVGNGTTINHVEVVANADDGIEWFGGSVSINWALIWNSFDDSFDTDMDWNGTASNFIIVTPNTGSAFELDGPEGSRTRGEDHIISEGVVYGGPDIDAIVDWDGSTNASLQNIYFFGISAGRVDSFGGVGTNANSNTTNWETDLADNSGGFFSDGDGVEAAGLSAAITYGVAVGSKSYGPTASDFAWTWAGNSGALGTLGL